MNSFLVLAPGRFLNEPGAEIAIKSFADLYHSVTPKHQRKIKLIIIEEEEQIPFLESQLSSQALCNSVDIINRNNTEHTEAAYREASLFLLPVVMDGYKIIPEALSFGLPVLTFEHPGVNEFLDHTCSMLVASPQLNQGHEEFSRLLEILYFDPEVRKILMKGAMFKYEKEWN